MESPNEPTPGEEIAEQIRMSGLGIYDQLDQRPELKYTIETLEARLEAKLVGIELKAPIRTRSAMAKAMVARTLGYVAPKTFRKVRPRFPGQDLDIFVQKSDNLQVWNDEISPTRRYVLIRLDVKDVISAVRVLSGEAVALLDTTGTLTSKFQAARLPGRTGSVLASDRDTENFLLRLQPSALSETDLRAQAASSAPVPGRVLPIDHVFERLLLLRGQTIEDPGADQERLRGAAFQRVVTNALGLGEYGDSGQFPDVRVQALEVKLQLSGTIDLGLVSPDDSTEAVELGGGIQHRDVRYAIAYAERVNQLVRVTDVVVSTGAGFFSEFRRFEGRVTNRKLQIPLPRQLFR